MSDSLNATLIKRVDITENLVIYSIKPDTAIPDFLPGQYVALGLPGSAPRYHGAAPDHEEIRPDKIIKRTYSIGSSPQQKEAYEFFLAIVPTGTLTPRLLSLKEGDRLFCATKVTGKFTLEAVPADAEVLMFATGTGIAPFIAMLRTSTTWTAGRKIKIVYGARYAKDLAYCDELAALAEKNQNFSFELIASREGPQWTGHRGHVQSLITNGVVKIDPAKTHAMLCGNPAMIDDLQKLLEERGLKLHSRKEPGNIHLEKYW